MIKLLSIIIPSYNSSKTIVHTLKALCLQTCLLPKEIIIVDSSDKENIIPAIKPYMTKEVKVINAGTRVMPAIGRNIGAKKAKGELLIFFDSDVIPESDCLNKIVAAYNNGCLAGCGAINVPVFQLKNIVALSQYYLQLNEYIPSGKPRIRLFPPGCNIFCSKKIFNDVKGFPEIRASEDTMFGINVSKITPVWFIPDIIVAHIFREDWRSYFKNQILLGKYIAIYKKSLKTSIILNRYIAICLFPAFFTVKVIIIIKRILKSNIKHIFRFVMISPFFIMGIFFWTIGFVSGCACAKESLNNLGKKSKEMGRSFTAN